MPSPHTALVVALAAGVFVTSTTPALAQSEAPPAGVRSESLAVVADSVAAPRPGIGIRPWTDVTTLTGDDSLSLAGIDFQIAEVPGHSPGHLAFYADGALFSGDVLFAGSVGRTDLPFGDWNTLVESIRSLVDRYPPETVVYSGHGPPTTLGAELERNPFLAELRAAHQ